MKKLILVFLLGLVFSCKQPKPEDPIKPTGTIVAVTKVNNITFILVEFYGETISQDRGDMIYQYWIYGSDTCKVGQIVNLK